jgi:uncharacterized membrane protein
MTVLVLGLALPSSPPRGENLPGELFDLLPRLLAYAMSFVVLGVYWVGHHNLFHYVKSTDRVFLWLNVLFMMSVGVIPFSTSVLGASFGRRSAVILYGINLSLAGLALYLIWWYATRNHRLVDHDIDPHVIVSAKRRILVGPAVNIVAIGLAFIAPILSVVLYIGELAFFILPGHIDVHFTRKHH